MGGQAFDTKDEKLVSLLYSSGRRLSTTTQSGEFVKKYVENTRSLSQSAPMKRKTRTTEDDEKTKVIFILPHSQPSCIL